MSTPATALRALTVKQPWAHAFVQGNKTPENRTRRLASTWRGRILILSSASTWNPHAAWFIAAMTGTPPPTRAGRHPGHYIGTVDLVDIHSATTTAASPGANQASGTT